MDPKFFTKLYSEYFSLKTDYAKYSFLLALNNFYDFFSDNGLNEINSWVKNNMQFLINKSQTDITTR